MLLILFEGGGTLFTGIAQKGNLSSRDKIALILRLKLI